MYNLRYVNKKNYIKLSTYIFKIHDNIEFYKYLIHIHIINI